MGVEVEEEVDEFGHGSGQRGRGRIGGTVRAPGGPHNMDRSGRGGENEKVGARRWIATGAGGRAHE